jgi:hypothetical protein
MRFLSRWLLRVTVLTIVVVSLTSCGGQGATALPTPSADWLTYADTEAGYSFRYPSDARFSSGKATDERFNYVYVILKIEGKLSSDEVEFYVLENPQQLSIEAFMRTKQAVRFLQPEDKWPSENYVRYAESLSIAEQSALQIERSTVTWPLTRICKYATYVPYGKLVIVAKLCPSVEIADGDYEPNPLGAELYNKILDTLQFSTEAGPGE